MMKISAALPTGRRIPVSVARTANVLQLKQQLQTKAGTPVAMQRLIFNGKILDDSTSLTACNIEPGVVVHLALTKASQSPSAQLPIPNAPEPTTQTKKVMGKTKIPKRLTPKSSAPTKPRKVAPRRPKPKAKAKHNNERQLALSSYIYKVLKQVHPDTGISNRAMAITNDCLTDLVHRLLSEAQALLLMDGKMTLTARHIQTAVRLCIPGELAKHAVSEGTKAVTKFGASTGSRSGMTRSRAAGLTMPVGRIQTWTKLRYPAIQRVGAFCVIYLAAVIEYMAAELLELSGNAARDAHHNRITPRHLMLAIRNDEELDRLLANVDIADGGVVPNIHASLIPRRMANQAADD